MRSAKSRRAQGKRGPWDVLASYTLAYNDGTVADYFDGFLANPRFTRFYDGWLPDDRRQCQRLLAWFGQPLQAPPDGHLDALRDADLFQRLDLPATLIPVDRPFLHQMLEHLLDEEWVALGLVMERGDERGRG